MNQQLMTTEIYYFLVSLSITIWGKTEIVGPATEVRQPEELEANRNWALTSDGAYVKKGTSENAIVQQKQQQWW